MVIKGAEECAASIFKAERSTLISRAVYTYDISEPLLTIKLNHFQKGSYFQNRCRNRLKSLTHIHLT